MKYDFTIKHATISRKPLAEFLAISRSCAETFYGPAGKASRGKKGVRDAFWKAQRKRWAKD